MIINLYDEICDKLPFSAGLNPKEFRFCFHNFLYLYFFCFPGTTKSLKMNILELKKISLTYNYCQFMHI